MIRNLLGEQAFNRLVELNLGAPASWKAYWSYEVTFAMQAVGISLRQYSIGASSTPRAFGETPVLSPVSGWSLLSPYMKALAEINQEVERQNLWQQLMAVRCGPAAVANLLERTGESSPMRDSFRNVWHRLASKSSPEEEREVSLSASQELIRIEQTHVLQEKFFSSIWISLAYSTRAMNKMIVSPSPAKPKAFDEYTRSVGLSNNLVDLNSRLSWMNYQLTADAEHLDKQTTAEAKTYLAAQRRRIACYLRDFL